MFDAIYRHTQYLLLKDTLMGFGLSQISPFIIYLLPGLFRIPALASPQKNKRCLYNFSKIFNTKDIKFYFEPHANAFDKIISSGALYNILLKYYSKNEVDSIIDELSKVATTGSYNDLIDKPTKLSDFNNDTNYVTL